MSSVVLACRMYSILAVVITLQVPSAVHAAERNARAGSGSIPKWAPVPDDHELAELWNDPEFVRRLVGSYGFASDVEPRLTPEELAVYRDKVIPVVRDDPVKAIPVLEGLVKPSASAVFDFTLGNAFFQTGDLTNAVKHFEEAVAKFPDYLRAQKNLGFALMREGRYPDAVRALTRAVRLGGAEGRVYGLLGFAYLNQGRNVSAEAAYRQALVFEPDNLDFKLGLVKAAVGSANYDHALAILDELVQQYPERDTLWTLRANLFIQKEQPARAAINLEILRRLGKAGAQSLFLLGDLHMASEARDLALSAYLEAIEKDDGKLIAKAMRAAEILVSRGAWPEAEAVMARVRAGQGPRLSEEDQLKLLKMEARVAMATGEGEKAIRTIEEIVARNPLDGDALLLAGDYYAKNDQREKAELRYTTAAGLEGFQAEAWVKHAQLLVQSRKYAEAMGLLQRAQKLKPRDHVQRYLEKVEAVAARAGRS